MLKKSTRALITRTKQIRQYPGMGKIGNAESRRLFAAKLKGMGKKERRSLYNPPKNSVARDNYR